MIGARMYIAGGIVLVGLFFAALYAFRAHNGTPHVLANTKIKAQALVFGLTVLLCFGLVMIVSDVF
jgi:hypothetical protein